MIIERTDKEVIIRLPSTINVDELQDMINYSRYKEISGMVAPTPQDEVDKLANEIKNNWWMENKNRFIK